MEYFWAYLLLGVFSGFIAGLLGVGGGLLIVPVLVGLFSQFMPETITMHMAIGTSLMSIVFTSLSSIWAHHRQQKVLWHIVQQLSGGIIIGAILGAIIADYLSSHYLRYIFTIFELFVAWQILFSLKPNANRSLPNKWIMLIVGNIIGFVSSILGIGAGTMTTPFLLWCRISLQKAIATSAAVGLPIAIAGSVAFIFIGEFNTARPNWSLGYVYSPALLGILLSSIIVAPLGAVLTHRLPTKPLKKIFALLLIVLAIKLLLD
jgi:uncharacterized membrane protein YfcA